MKPYHRGFLLGKFLPPHAGHLYLIDEASRQCADLIVLLCSIEAETIPGELRYHWLRALRPEHRVLHCTEEVPQTPEDHPEFWTIWEDLLRRWLPCDVQVVFSSEEYGEEIARRLGIDHVPVDRERCAVPVSGTEIRGDPLRYWHFIPDVVRPYFTRTVAVLGPESSGKSTLTRQLAEAFSTAHVPEYGREYTRPMGNRVSSEIVLDDFWVISQEHGRRVAGALRGAYRVLFVDTEALTTAIWSEWYLDEVEHRLWSFVDAQHIDLYLLCAPDLDWEDDGTREFPARRQTHFERLRSELDRRAWPYRIIRGEGEARLQAAVAAITEYWPALVDCGRVSPQQSP